MPHCTFDFQVYFGNPVVEIHRTRLYEDAFKGLAPLGARMKFRVPISFIGAQGVSPRWLASHFSGS
jgi:hypothetical protein